MSMDNRTKAIIETLIARRKLIKPNCKHCQECVSVLTELLEKDRYRPLTMSWSEPESAVDRMAGSFTQQEIEDSTGWK